MRKQLIGGAAAALSVAVLAGGCAANANQDSAGSGASSLVIGYSEGGSVLDPAEANDLTSDTFVYAAYDQLVQPKVEERDGTAVADSGQFDPMLAESWETSDDERTWTFHLRDDVTFQSGNPLTADDVVYSFEHVRDSSSASFMYELANIEDVEATDEHTVTLTLSQPTSLLLPLVSQYSWSIIDSETAEANGGAEWLARNTAGSGPYTIEEWDPATQAVLQANTDYWQGAPQLEQVTMKFISEASNRVQLLDQGSIDAAIEIPAKDIETLQRNEDLAVSSEPSNRILYFALNTEVEPFDDPEVREALSYAIPYDQLVDDVMYGQAEPLRSALPSTMPGHTDSGNPYSYDPDKARELLREAGYEDGFEFTFTLGSGFQDWNDDAVLIKAALEDVGVTMNIENMARQQFLETIKEGSAEAFISKWTSFVNDPGYHLGFLLATDASSNYGHYSNPEVDELLDQARDEQDADKRDALYAEAQDLITADAPWLYLYQYKQVVVTSTAVRGYTFYPDEIIRFYPMSKEEA
ncbi:ABC transporter substrate-binding protein [Marinitenerispora sediminis]|uniref:Peptide ABC transporter substrate-binding protein n=1 Tax=Marinitenerispora sediminis TaxID=1931232 RepID=A0A368T9H2_9ACTN|nr:ABC transporter substrate-binding protein [Marinitenerispora sediminis]RCV54596.1 peptide ABC transporter substrate-binding protein [Marinitenerispora sediminis]RCV59849.1 peptide ABC transporter substrate-binding protein [Marinitenerispora sediminis]RCV61176.1 peptide ABC transporter substrate-binding protein [Marinitenerispora sediminis]